MTLTTLVDGCALSLLRGSTLPPEATDDVILSHDGQKSSIKTPNQMANCVKINSGDEALEYLRFFSSYRTSYLFKPERLEVFVGNCDFVCLSTSVSGKLGMHPARVVSFGSSYIVNRFIIKHRGDWKVSLFEVEDKVNKDGTVRLLKEKRVKATDEQLKSLSFPAFL